MFYTVEAILGDLMAPYVLLPGQLSHGPSATPERQLICAILEDAIRCYLGVAAAPRSDIARRLQQEAEAWFFDRKTAADAALSCEEVCEQLSINVDALRDRLKLGRVVATPLQRRVITRGVKPQANRARRAA